MNIQRILLLMTAIVAVLPVSVLAMSGGNYEISWSTIDGGGGNSTGGDSELKKADFFLTTLRQVIGYFSDKP